MNHKLTNYFQLKVNGHKIVLIRKFCVVFLTFLHFCLLLCFCFEAHDLCRLSKEINFLVH